MFILAVRKHSHELLKSENITDNNNDVDYEHQSDSEILLGKVQRDFSRRSKKLSGKGRNLLTGQSSSSELDEAKTKSNNSIIKPLPAKSKPQIAPRTITKPVIPTRKTTISSSSDTKKETSPRQNLSPNSICSPDHFW